MTLFEPEFSPDFLQMEFGFCKGVNYYQMSFAEVTVNVGLVLLQKQSASEAGQQDRWVGHRTHRYSALRHRLPPHFLVPDDSLPSLLLLFLLGPILPRFSRWGRCVNISRKVFLFSSSSWKRTLGATCHISGQDTGNCGRIGWSIKEGYICRWMSALWCRIGGTTSYIPIIHRVWNWKTENIPDTLRA